MNEEKRFAVLIDTDNISTKYIANIMSEISNYGVATYKRAYGDLTRKENKNWEKILLEHSITPVLQYSYTFGKNSTDSAMIIDAMDILYSGHVEGFCIVSSDSDFTRLAVRLRESGMTVIGMGEKKSAKPFVKSCTLFKYLDLISKNETDNKKNRKSELPEQVEDVADIDESLEENEVVDKNDILAAIIDIFNERDVDREGLNIGELGQRLTKIYSDFDVRNYGYSRLSVFLKSFDCLETKDAYVYLRNGQVGSIPTLTELEGTIIAFLKKHRSRDGVNIVVMKRVLEEEYPGFDIANYGYSKLSTFFKDFSSLETKLSGKSNSVMSLFLKA
ncbi:MAG: NYN domain-containing protein [Lachnospiraceae bacterium]|nr:NYN domain-containing protein [Lachnospiraceae bacterium]